MALTPKEIADIRTHLNQIMEEAIKDVNRLYALVNGKWVTKQDSPWGWMVYQENIQPGERAPYFCHEPEAKKHAEELAAWLNSQLL